MRSIFRARTDHLVLEGLSVARKKMNVQGEASPRLFGRSPSYALLASLLQMPGGGTQTSKKLTAVCFQAGRKKGTVAYCTPADQWGWARVMQFAPCGAAETVPGSKAQPCTALTRSRLAERVQRSAPAWQPRLCRRCLRAARMGGVRVQAVAAAESLGLRTYDSEQMAAADLSAFTARPRIDFGAILRTVRSLLAFK